MDKTTYRFGPPAVHSKDSDGMPTVTISRFEYDRLLSCESAWVQCFDALRAPIGAPAQPIVFAGTTGAEGAVLEIRRLQSVEKQAKGQAE